ncbi:hypothetical protein CYMTET_28850 [Cymbomonas tetramitiformis]|uniref:GAF domain-containing protein n=1 Tax=Cymbomonas tetramitiformis TaxID=36881 RepID=A0AAE0FM56_9CHLO|nr:hypothetical protein CYMTET_28850 [Cymbomonas tetramitiformis]|eukprot:gene2663-3432_t
MGLLSNFSIGELSAEISRRICPNFPPPAGAFPEAQAPCTVQITVASDTGSSVKSLVNVMTRCAAEMNPDRATQVVVRETCEALHADRCTIFNVEESTGNLVMKTATGLQDLVIPAGQGIAGQVAQTKTSVIVDDAYSCKLFDTSIDKDTGYKTNTLLVVPVCDVAGRTTAVLQVVNKQSGEHFTETDKLMAENIAAMAGIILRTCSLYDEGIRHEKRAKGIVDIILSLKQDMNLNSFLFTVNRSLQELSDAEKATFFIVEGSNLISATTDSGKQIRIPKTAGLVGACCLEAKTINIKDAYADDRFDTSNDKKTGFTTRSILCVPIVVTEDEITVCIGVLQMINKKNEPCFAEEDVLLLEQLASLMSEKVAELLNNQTTQVRRNRLDSGPGYSDNPAQDLENFKKKKYAGKLPPISAGVPGIVEEEEEEEC